MAQHQTTHPTPFPSSSSSQSQRDSRAQIAALQQQLAQLSQQQRETFAEPTPQDALAAEQYLVFTLLGREFAIKAAHIQGVERLTDITPLPHVASWVRGVINLRGSILSVIDFRSFLDQDTLPYNPRTRLLSLQYDTMAACFAVDGVNEMLPLPAQAISSHSGAHHSIIPPWVAPYASGSALLNRRSIVLLDTARLLFSDHLQHYEALQ